MSKGKATFVTATIAIMLFVIALGLYLIWKPGFFIIFAIFATYGYLDGFCDFHSWLSSSPRQNEYPEPPDIVTGSPVDDWDADIPGGTDGLEAIINEVKAADE